MVTRPDGNEASACPPPTPVVPPAFLSRHGARVLDPDQAVRVPGQRLNPTVYLAQQLLIRGLPDGSAGAVVERLQAWSDERRLGLRWTMSPRHLAAAKSLDLRDHKVLDRTFHTAVQITATGDEPAAPPDAWVLLQQLRYEFRDDPGFTRLLALDHLMAAGASWQGVGGMWAGVGGIWAGVGGMWAGVGGSGAPYGGGYGGRTPVVWSAPDPRMTAPATKYEPVVAVLDSGIGRHPWFAVEGDGFTRFRGAGTDPVVLDQLDAADPGFTGVVSDPLTGLVDRLAGHGTFVAGIVRQRCARAHLLDVPVMAADGAVAESDVLLALNELLQLHLRGEVPVRSGDETVGRRLDVVNLSMGYYHETPDDPIAASALAAVLHALSEAGVAVVAAAGNAATSTQFYPAALSTAVSGPPALVSVGALNPDDHTVAAFSNNGRWVTTHAPGAGVVSTVPATLTGSYGRQLAVRRDDPLTRGTVDPDDFRSGFAIWSGTSFAAPWVAGDIAAGTAHTGDVPGAVAEVLAERAAHLAATRHGDQP